MRIGIAAIFTCLFFPLCGQEIKSPAQIVEELGKTGRVILENPEFKKRDSANRHFTTLLKEYISTEQGYRDPLKQVSNMLRLSEKNGEFHIYTWQMPDSTFTYRQYGLVAAQTRRGVEVTELEDKKSSLVEPEFRMLKADDWYGAIYYDMVPVKKGRTTYYTLLGYVPGARINRKVVDVMTLDGRGRPKFGARIFHVEEFMDQVYRKAPMRLILSYSGDYSASVRWNPETEMVIMDHLVPPEPKMKGVYQLYGPDMSYDGLEWDDDWWYLRKEVEFNTGQHIPIVPPSKPTGLPPSDPKFINKRRQN
ncbi:MAG TPA: hypothetical protein DCG19_14360 [Cryomorphaceae bacterium]|nr:hypothetical protein [Owenweeksia sp.]MBF98110.1 hypothetical protein [Owenweeksia sp.]HAD98590.1 hypothetical protein [Cryomorphaceae bacterium]HBF19945.1 hypothetical protein [Cryomorphaceae bacterium]|tara:strand:- start:876 stop:1796 length:921 start_codon:yes stop_codon:yes gene_type:complete